MPTTPKRKKNNKSQPKQRIDIEPRHNDVMLGRGNGIATWPGNLTFRSVVWHHRCEYKVAKRHEKSIIAQKVIDAIESLNPPGRFIEKLSENDASFCLVDPDRVLEKACQALRERKMRGPPRENKLESRQARALIHQLKLKNKERHMKKKASVTETKLNNTTAAKQEVVKTIKVIKRKKRVKLARRTELKRLKKYVPKEQVNRTEQEQEEKRTANGIKSETTQITRKVSNEHVEKIDQESAEKKAEDRSLTGAGSEINGHEKTVRKDRADHSKHEQMETKAKKPTASGITTNINQLTKPAPKELVDHSKQGQAEEEAKEPTAAGSQSETNRPEKNVPKDQIDQSKRDQTEEQANEPTATNSKAVANQHEKNVPKKQVEQSKQEQAEMIAKEPTSTDIKPVTNQQDINVPMEHVDQSKRGQAEETGKELTTTSIGTATKRLRIKIPKQPVERTKYEQAEKKMMVSTSAGIGFETNSIEKYVRKERVDNLKQEQAGKTLKDSIITGSQHPLRLTRNRIDQEIKRYKGFGVQNDGKSGAEEKINTTLSFSTTSKSKSNNIFEKSDEIGIAEGVSSKEDTPTAIRAEGGLQKKKKRQHSKGKLSRPKQCTTSSQVHPSLSDHTSKSMLPQIDSKKASSKRLCKEISTESVTNRSGRKVLRKVSIGPDCVAKADLISPAELPAGKLQETEEMPKEDITANIDFDINEESEYFFEFEDLTEDDVQALIKIPPFPAQTKKSTTTTLSDRKYPKKQPRKSSTSKPVKNLEKEATTEPPATKPSSESSTPQPCIKENSLPNPPFPENDDHEKELEVRDAAVDTTDNDEFHQENFEEVEDEYLPLPVAYSLWPSTSDAWSSGTIDEYCHFLPHDLHENARGESGGHEMYFGYPMVQRNRFVSELNKTFPPPYPTHPGYYHM